MIKKVTYHYCRKRQSVNENNSTKWYFYNSFSGYINAVDGVTLKTLNSKQIKYWADVLMYWKHELKLDADKLRYEMQSK